ncbi:MAG: glycosyltransferase family 4 protein [Sphingobacteriales bacterium]|nr:glycosyltransferase family 4 protein [Sphingobacteriales bacterium]
MRIAFDAKRAFQNTTGLGHYSRTLIYSLAGYFPEHEYFLFAPKETNLFHPGELDNIQTVTPSSFPSTLFPSAWRSSWVKKDLVQYKIELYHGLSHEIPVGIQKTGIKSVVTIHDLIFERYPEQYNAIDIKIYRKKFKYACEYSDKIIAISQQTKADIIEFYKTDPDKISVCYQSCNPAFAKTIDEKEKKRVRVLYGLPEKYFLYVGSVIERKNLLTVCRAMKHVGISNAVPLVVIGEGGKYMQQVKQFVKENRLSSQIIFLSEKDAAKQSDGFRTASDFPAIYQSAVCMIYPSIFEGFGIPVLEALWSRLPVITSNVSCMPETGGNAAFYISPFDDIKLAEGMLKIYEDNTYANELKEKGWNHAQNFTPYNCAAAVMNEYKRIMG